LRQQQTAVEAQIAALRTQLEGLTRELKTVGDNSLQKTALLSRQKKELSRVRRAD
jgi:molybdopterin biosynthesis enzyme MoaB